MKVAVAAQAQAEKIAQRVVITIVGPAGDLIYFTKMDGAQYASVDVSQPGWGGRPHPRPMKVHEDGLAEGGGGMSILLLPNVIARPAASH